MPGKRFTKQSPNNHPDQKITYMAPGQWIDEFSMKSFHGNVYIYGDLINKLGRYEDLGEPEEIAKKLGANPVWMK